MMPKTWDAYELLNERRRNALGDPDEAMHGESRPPDDPSLRAEVVGLDIDIDDLNDTASNVLYSVFGPNLDPDVVASLKALVIDGFIAGALYEREVVE